MRLADVQPPGRIGPQDISVDSTVSTFYDNTLRIQWAWGTDARLHFVLDNLTPDSLRVIWEDARYVDERQNSHRVMHAGVKFADRGEPRLEIPVAPLGKMVDFVQPVYVLIPDPRDSTALLRKPPLMKIRGAKKIHYDSGPNMTPLVDVAFLLLTFFMFTTSMSRPQTMEINLPPDKDVKVEVAESNLLTLRVNDKGDVFWSTGIEAPKRLERKELRAFLKEKAIQNPKLIVLVKVDRAGKYNMMVDLIDELNLANVTRFSLAPLLEADKNLIAKAA